ncbi:MGH1-like glycoside hydrolase domain-containing protein [Mucilaginibacter aquatilis]|uniref:Mannosylglycerate hydrolase MGH1-like glycoside hydrolase domain-containing protein n=1 Tax=Mucilaginibacter aquatilis TaxID=1517760 RepID=A0A6I4I8M5_9SPHI|nr:trehalase family glycosidase [Mucilaginibacter aquatilis]MVN91257.1 hypothetical protein [Mucilaginibacter aquatilis]
MALPAWGPYSTNYNGISHVPARNNGIRFDVIVQPSFYLRNNIALASTQRESGYHPWQASPTLSYFSYRYELEWKDRVYCDVSFSEIDKQSRLIKAEFVNNTQSNRSLALNLFSTISYPYNKKVKAILPEGTSWQEAASYISFTDSVKPANYNLIYNGQLRGQVTDENAVSGTAIQTSKIAGQIINYNLSNLRHSKNGVIIIRYKNNGSKDARLQAVVNGRRAKVLAFKPTTNYTQLALNVDDLKGKFLSFLLNTIGDGSIFLDGFALVDNDDVPSVKFQNEELNLKPEITKVLHNGAILKYNDIEEYYGILWQDTTADRRTILDQSPDEALAKFDNLVKAGHARLNGGRINGNGKGYFDNVFITPIVVKPGQTLSKNFIVVSGSTKDQVVEKLKSFNSQWASFETAYTKRKNEAALPQVNQGGKPFSFSQQLMAATVLTNLNYPVFAGNKYFKHTTPGKRWSSFYTWDSGFIGLGYTNINLGRALESLNAYTMGEEEQSAFLEHGTPLPVQAYLFNELWDKTQNLEYLKYFYPRLKRYYSFLAGAENSPTHRLKSGMIQTWDIFYNSGGWDDYSPQVYTHHKKLEKFIAPVINTAHQIRFAKLLKAAAWQLGYKQDIAIYDEDIKVYTNALQQNSWDETSGYFGYVNHDANGKAIGILKHDTGVNYNMGLDGCSPLIAGICTPQQQAKLLANLFTNGKLWTDQGITAIDQSSPYYNKDGYWNGRVWMPHQWFLWKTMFDLNEPERALQIANTALNVWKRETDDTYNCWENFGVETGNGGGWHQFGALSSPVINWYNALYKPGTITHGFNLWCIKQRLGANNDGYNGEFQLFDNASNNGAAMLLCLNENFEYKATCNNQPINLTKVANGLYILKITTQSKGKFSIQVIKKV